MAEQAMLWLTVLEGMEMLEPPTSTVKEVGVLPRVTFAMASTSKLPGSPVKYWCHMPAMLPLVRLGKLEAPAAVS
jgi:hypothetical protein